MALDVVGRAAVYHYFVIRFQHKGSVSVIHKSVLDRERIKLANITGGHHAIRVFLPAGYVYAGSGGSILQTAGQNNEILNSHILGKRESAGSIHHAGYCQGSMIFEIETAGNEQFVVILKHEVWSFSFQDVREVQ